MKHNILIVEDDLLSASYLKKLCNEHGFTVTDIVSNAKDALRVIKKSTIDLILMDIMIEGPLSGCELAMHIRSFNKEVIIVFLTAYTSEEMISYALDVKAYSYLIKPYRDVEIISTVRMALHDHSTTYKTTQEHIIECKNGFKLDTRTKQIYHHSQELFLSTKLHTLLVILMRHRGTSLSYEQIAHEIDYPHINTLRSSIHRLKMKLPSLDLHAVPKVGYVLY